jgi:hypothetical protein
MQVCLFDPNICLLIPSHFHIKKSAHLHIRTSAHPHISDFLTKMSVMQAFYSIAVAYNFTPDYKTNNYCKGYLSPGH